MNVISKLAKAMGEVKSVEKDGKNTFQHYSFQSEGAVKAAVKKALSDNGLVIIPTYEIVQQYDKKSAKGGITHFVDVMGTFEITDGETSYFGKMAGSGQDTAEKAMVKAETTAQKYFYKQLFNISDQEEDPDCSDSGKYVTETKPQSRIKNTKTISKLDQLKQNYTALMAKVCDAKKLKAADLQAELIKGLTGTNEERYEAMITKLEMMLQGQQEEQQLNI